MTRPASERKAGPGGRRRGHLCPRALPWSVKRKLHADLECGDTSPLSPSGQECPSYKHAIDRPPDYSVKMATLILQPTAFSLPNADSNPSRMVSG